MAAKIITCTCSRCGKPNPVPLVEGVDVSKEPELRSQVLNASIFRYQCASCRTINWISYPFLYHDPSRRFMVQLVDPRETGDPFLKAFSSGNETDEALKGVVADMKNRYNLRTVHTPNELMEKIQIFEAGFDDRLLEIYKHEIIAGEQTRRIIALWFHTAKETGPFFYVEDPEGIHEGIAIKRVRYEALQEEYKDLDQDRSETLIDQAWAIRHTKQTA